MHHREGIAPRVLTVLPFALTIACLLSTAGRPDGRRESVAAYIKRVNPAFPNAHEAANQLLYAEAKGGAKAELMAAMVAVERHWRLEADDQYGAANLCQITRGTAKATFGRSRARSWQENLLWGSCILAGCIKGEGDEKRGLRRYNGGPLWRQKPATLRYAEAVLKCRP